MSKKTTSGKIAKGKKPKVSKKGKKAGIVGRVVEHFRDYQARRSNATPKELFSVYEDLSMQNKNAYRDIGIDDRSISTATMTVDFERATKYIFESIFRLTVKTQTPGREEPDGVVKEDKIILFRCVGHIDRRAFQRYATRYPLAQS